MNTKKSLIATVAAILITAVMHAQQASEDLTAEQQLAQRKSALDAREKALNEREKMLAEKERATASSTSRSREKGKAKAKHQQTIAQSQEEQAKAARAEKKLHEPFAQRLGEAFLEQLGTAAYTPPEPGATPTPRRIPPAPFDSPPFPSADWQIGGSPVIGDPGQLAPYPLMQAIYEGPGGQAWKDSKVQIYGWVNFSGNISTSHPSKQSENGISPWFMTFGRTGWS